MPKKLSSLEAERLEYSRVLKELRQKETAFLAQAMERLSDRQKILELQIKNLDIERFLISKDREAVKAKTAQERKDHDALLEQIRKRLKLKGTFGYNPDTLEIIQDE